MSSLAVVARSRAPEVRWRGCEPTLSFDLMSRCASQKIDDIADLTGVSREDAIVLLRGLNYNEDKCVRPETRTEGGKEGGDVIQGPQTRSTPDSNPVHLLLLLLLLLLLPLHFSFFSSPRSFPLRLCVSSLPTRLKERFFDNSEALLADLHMTLSPDPAPYPADMPETDVMCDVCYGSVDSRAQMDAAPCGHFACASCWTGHLQGAAMNKGILSVSCMGCAEPLRDRMFRKYLTLEQRRKVHLWDLGMLASQSSDTRQCPAPSCTYLVRYPKGIARDVHCRCGFIFCFQCMKEGHAPATCSAAEKWRERSVEDRQMFSWLFSNCRPCPRCHMMIEKNDGCSSMTCGRHAHGGVIAAGHGCGLHFCWICMQSYEDHASKGCRPYNPETAKTADEDMNRIVGVLNKFDHCTKARQFALKLRPRVAEDMDRLVAVHRFGVREVEVLARAVETLAEGRRIQGYTYLWGHYDSVETVRALFADNQRMLEDRLERLQEMLEGTAGKPALSHDIALRNADEVSKAELDAFHEELVAIRDAVDVIQRFSRGVVEHAQVVVLEKETGMEAAGGGGGRAGAGGGGSGGGAAGTSGKATKATGKGAK